MLQYQQNTAWSTLQTPQKRTQRIYAECTKCYETQLLWYRDIMAIHEFSCESCLNQAEAFSTSTVKVQGTLGVLIIMWSGKLMTTVRHLSLRTFWDLPMNDTLSTRFLAALTTKQDKKIEYQRQTRTQEKFQREKYYSNISFLLLIK